jgi:hypothetical protein
VVKAAPDSAVQEALEKSKFVICNLWRQKRQSVLKFIFSAKGGNCDYSTQVSKTLATLLKSKILRQLQLFWTTMDP